MRLALAGPRKWSLIQKRHPQAVSLAKEWIGAQLDIATMTGNCEAISSLQLGLDTIFASLCIHKGIPLTVILSCKKQDKYWDESNKKTYNYLLSKAKIVDTGLDRYNKQCILDQSQKIDMWLSQESCTLFLVRYQSLSLAQNSRLVYARQHAAEIKTYRIRP
jgi:uncharacterized phage-like protein YoqJ